MAIRRYCRHYIRTFTFINVLYLVFSFILLFYFRLLLVREDRHSFINFKRTMIERIYKLFERLADIGSDKYLHFIVGMMVAAIMRLHVGALAALTAVTIVMIAKETIDHFIRKENFDLTDALFGVMGGVITLILMI